MSIKSKVGAIVAVLFMIIFVMGCATPIPIGVAVTDLKLPVVVTSNIAKSSKVGTAECKSYFGLVATGDVSIETAMKNGGITKVHYVDWEVNNILGIIGTYKIIVYGE